VSGDVSLSPQRTVAGAVPPRRRVDVLILESTYGNRLHSQRAAEEERLITQIAAVIGRGGHVLIPAFALSRAQEVLLILAAARRSGRLRAPVCAGRAA
jgi:Cft2 family RNA processing exonuclease